MTFEEAVRASIRAYYEDQGFENYETTRGKPLKYSKKYFDKMEQDLIPAEEVQDES